MINYKHHNPKQMVSTVAFVLERRLKLKVYEVQLSLRHFFGYNSAWFLKPATPLRLPGRFEWGFILVLKTLAISHKQKEEALIRKACTQRM